MKSNGSVENHSLTSDLQRLLVDLSALETCTISVLNLVKSVLGPGTPRQSSATKNVSKTRPVARARRGVATTSKDHLDNSKCNLTSTSRHAQQVIKTCLSTLKQDSALLLSTANVRETADHTQRMIGASKQYGPVDVVAICCDEALKAWSRSSSLEHKDRLAIVKTRFNLSNRLLDLKRLHMLQVNLDALHSLLQFDNLQDNARSAKSVRDCSSYLRISKNEFTGSEPGIVSSTQLLVLRYLHLRGTQLCETFTDDLESDGGPLSWLKTTSASHNDESTRIHRSINRQLLKMAALVTRSMRLSFATIVVDSILNEQEDDDKTVALVYFSHALDGSCNHSDYNKVHKVAQRLLDHWRLTGITHASEPVLLLVERMTRLSRDLGLQKDREAWLRETLCLSDSTEEQVEANVFSSLKRYALELLGTTDTVGCSSIMLAAVKAIQGAARSDTFFKQDISLVDDCVVNLRASIMKCLKINVELRTCSQTLLGATIELLLRINTNAPQQASPRYVNISTSIVQLWLKLARAGEGTDSILELVEQAQFGLELSQRLELEDEIHAICVNLFNAAGRLYNKAQFEQAAELLEIYFYWRPTTPETAKQVEYLWSSYMKCGNLMKALSWLNRATELLSTDLCRPQDYIVEQIVKQHPELVRIMGKVVQLSSENPDSELQLPLNIDENVRPLLLELQLNRLSLLNNDKWCLNNIESILSKILELYQSPMQEENRLRVLSFIVAYFHRCGDIPRVKNYLKLYSSTVDEVESSSKHSTLRQLFRLRLVIHQLSLLTSHESSDFSLAPIVQLVREIRKQDDDCLNRFCIQVLQEMEDIFHHLHLPIKSVTAIDLLLTNFGALYQGILSKTDIIALLTKAAEHSTSCGYDGRASGYLAQAAVLVTGTDLGVIEEYKFAVALFQLSPTRGLADARQRIENIARLLTSMPRKGVLQYRKQFLTCLSKFAEDVGCLGKAIQFKQEALSAERSYLQQSSPCSEQLSTEDAIVADFSNLAVDEPKPATSTSILLMDILGDLARLYEKAGLIRDAIFYRQEACKVAERIGDQLYHDKTHLSMNLLRARAGHADIEKKLQEFSMQNPYESAEAVLGNAELLFELDVDSAVRILQACEKNLEKAMDQDSVFLTVKQAPTKSSSSSKVLANKQLKALDKPNYRLQYVSARVQSSLLTVYEKKAPCEELEPCVSRLQQDKDRNPFGGDEILVIAQHKLCHAQSLLTNHPVYGALHDSALSLPSVCPVIHNRVPKMRNVRQNTKSHPRGSPIANLDAALQELSTIRQSLMEIFIGRLQFGDVLAGKACGHLYHTLELLQASLVSPDISNTVGSANSTYLLETTKALSIAHERQRKSAEIASILKLDWQERLDEMMDEQIPDRSDYQRQFIDLIPRDWIVVAASLSPSGKELILSRIQAGKSTLIIRLPMSRHASRDVDEETFTFLNAREELRDIISQSDSSAQEAKLIKDKDGKTRWWKLRQELDDRLSTLLDNMEHCWLGGFVGIFGGSLMRNSDPDSFRVAFGRIILKHVPLKSSRTFDIDTRILDLFLDLGPLEGNESLEILEDLLYFVLDIYQFHGESIAYDEIDIDQMVVDIQVALANYHNRSTALATGHTILILDKALHIFPWESLPCLRTRSVSRVPSLLLLRDLLQSRASSLLVTRGPGSYVLNPSKDLKSTERTFLRTLQSLPDWSGISGRQPDEVEMVSLLESSSIFVYFGHGGGEQYIRGSKIRKLKSCGVVILMGCSSGALKDQGIFDPWGTPYNYIVADCPSLVVNLWDVTDKDIDRFSLKMLSKWSLIAGDSDSMSICEAVAQSRDECVLKYLNGAAPVVYGLPLKLEPRTKQ